MKHATDVTLYKFVTLTNNATTSVRMTNTFVTLVILKVTSKLHSFFQNLLTEPNHVT